MKKDIEYIEIMLSDFSVFHIDKDNLLEFDIDLKPERIDTSLFDFENSLQPIVKSLLLVVDDYTKILNITDVNDFDINRKDIAQISIYFQNEKCKNAFVNLTQEDYNKNQINVLDGNRLYITIEEK